MNPVPSDLEIELGKFTIESKAFKFLVAERLSGGVLLSLFYSTLFSNSKAPIVTRRLQLLVSAIQLLVDMESPCGGGWVVGVDIHVTM